MDWKISDPITCSGSVCPLPEKNKKFLLVHEFSNYDLKYHIFKGDVWYTALFSNDHFLNSKALVAEQGFLFVRPLLPRKTPYCIYSKINLVQLL